MLRNEAALLEMTGHAHASREQGTERFPQGDLTDGDLALSTMTGDLNFRRCLGST